MKIRLIPTMFVLLSVSAFAQSNNKTWTFAVSGDSRNCGDIVMPAIAAGAKAARAQFYWHLGDFRLGSGPDEDLNDAYRLRNNRDMTKEEYSQEIWKDFLGNQVAPFKRLGIPVYLSTGNHEFVIKTRQEYDETFASFLSGRDILPAPEHRERSYYHWRRRGLDFITLDNGTPDEFDADQLQWFEAVLKEDEADPKIKSVVVGMHKALPDSVGCDHSMNEEEKGDLAARAVTSGRQAYSDLLSFRSRSHKKVYLLASHSHFYMSDIFGDLPPEQRIPGWIVGTAGARRYPLPANDLKAGNAVEWTYGYLLGTVLQDGSIQFRFHQVFPSDYAAADARRIEHDYTPPLREACWTDNRSNAPRPNIVCQAPATIP